MEYKDCFEITPTSGLSPECPCNCVRCQHFHGVWIHGDYSVDIKCDLDDNED